MAKIKIAITSISIITSVVLAIKFKINIVYIIGIIFIALYILGMMILWLNEFLEEISDKIKAKTKLGSKKQMVYKISNLENKINEYKQKINDLQTQLECERISEISCIQERVIKYYIYVHPEENNTLKVGEGYRQIADVLVSSYHLFANYNDEIIELNNRITSYYLQKIYWNLNGGEREFLKDDDHGFPMNILEIDKYTDCQDSKGKKYKVLLTLDTAESNIIELTSIKDLYNKQNNKFKKIFNDKKINYPYMADLISTYERDYFSKCINDLKNKPHPAIKKANELEKKFLDKVAYLTAENIKQKGKLAEYEKEKS